MNKKELISRATDILRINDVKKPLRRERAVFHISDDEGNTKDFVVTKGDRRVIYTIDDVSAVLDACLEVMFDALKHGEPVNIRNLGTIGFAFRKGHSSVSVDTGERIMVPDHYSPKIWFSENIKRLTRIYEMTVREDMDKVAELENKMAEQRFYVPETVYHNVSAPGDLNAKEGEDNVS